MKANNLEEKEIQKKLKWLMILRLAMVTLFLASSIIFQIRLGRYSEVPAFYLLVIAVYLISIVYALLVTRVKKIELFAYIQIIGDLIIETFLAYITGGIESSFAFTYIITIIYASIILDKNGGYVIAGISGILFGGLADLQYYGFFEKLGPSSLSPGETFYKIFLYVVFFFIVAFLSGGLAERLRETGEILKEKDTDLAELQTFYKNVAQSMSSGLLTTDLKGRITSFNRAAEDITGYLFEEVKGRTWYDIFNLEEIKSVFSKLEMLRIPFRSEGSYVRKDKAKLVLGITISSLKNESGETTGAIGIFQDLTKIKEMEDDIKKKEKLAMVGELAAGMAHEIRNPLASLSGSMQILKGESFLKGENKKLLEIALRETEKLNRIISDFLTYARPTPLNKKRCDINKLLDDTAILLRNSKEYLNKIKIDTNLENGKLMAEADPNQMSQVFWNLSINAVQAMPDGGELMIISKRKARKGKGYPADSSKNYIEITFKDTGNGIKPELKEKIFYPFFTTKDKGSGLGLAIVHRIIDEHKGEIKVESKISEGSKFIIHLPTA
ncbi:MAG: PAS domain S-box protein [Nitrospirae bacterium]|nr:PAS domain S-box protein [Nitrospirota bacterium]